MKKILILAFCFTLPLVSCNKWLDQPPTGNLREDLFNTADDAQETLNSCYDALANLYDGRIQNISELLSDNLNQPNTNNDLRSVFARQTTFFNGTTNKVYQDLYTVVWRCNTLLDNIDVIPNFDSGEKERLIAEARFLRGFCHWAAVKLWAQPYGWTPGNTHAGVPIRSKAAADPLLRSTVQEVYNFVQEDLEFAYNNLPQTNGIYASKMAAAGVLATFHFLKQEWSKAVEYSSEVINSGLYTLDTSLDRYPEITQGSNTTSEFVFGTVSTLYSINGGSLAQDRRCGSYVSNYQINNGIAELMVSQNFQNFINLNPADNELMATMIGNFNDGSVAGKVQWGSGWWFLDQKDGMTKQLNALSNMGLLSKFIGMLTDSRSFMSFPRHEYFRRLLCNLFGEEIEKGELPNDIEWVGKIIKDICFNLNLF